MSAGPSSWRTTESTRSSGLEPAAATAATDRIDGAGRFLIPGLIDSHAHGGQDLHLVEVTFSLMVANGVTGVRAFGAHCWVPAENEICLVEAGIAPVDVLRAATTLPAEYLGRTDDLGGISVGRLADLVLLDADPLADIRNTTKIEAVLMAGRVYDRLALDASLQGLEASVAGSEESGG